MRILLPLCLAALGLTVACTTPTQVQGLESSLDDIQTQVLKLQKDSAAQTEALEAVRDSLEAQDDQQREGWADVAVTVEALTTEIKRMAPTSSSTTSPTTTSSTPAAPTPPPPLASVVNALKASADSARQLASTSSDYRAGLLGSIAASCTASYTVALAPGAAA